ncbi:MAG: sugar phosphate nucleotidyltransferase [Candidatus Actinomarina sp.]|tara:strand:- start:5422 stop:6129 length:708 start_codon:yes stop_codon:yes gene_type:complete
MQKKNSCDVVLLAGGKGTRMRELTEELPKPMVRVGNTPVLEHLINIFNNFGDFNFIVCTGYLNNKIEEYFENWKNVRLVYTGDETNTGGRLKKVAEMINGQFIVTYGDGLANVDIRKLLNFHESHDLIGTVTVTNPTSRFGMVNFDNEHKVTSFIEKPKLEGYINMGFMTFEKEFLNYLDNNSILESLPLQNLSRDNQLAAYVHDGYFEPMDTYREFLTLNEYWKSGNPPWQNFT